MFLTEAIDPLIIAEKEMLEKYRIKMAGLIYRGSGIQIIKSLKRQEIDGGQGLLWINYCFGIIYDHLRASFSIQHHDWPAS